MIRYIEFRLERNQELHTVDDAMVLDVEQIKKVMPLDE